jgi:hypothetical protein
MTVGGRYLYVAGGRLDGQMQTTAYAFDLFGQRAARVADHLPARDRTRVALGFGGRTLFFVGGRDPAGQAHDDVWAASLVSASQARLVAADTADRARMDPARTLILASDDGREVRTVRVDTALPSMVDVARRSEEGWTAISPTGVDLTRAMCGHPRGGEACSVSPDWWATPGRRGCAAPHACIGAPGVLAATVTLPVNARDVALDGREAWVLTDGALAHWQLAPVLAAGAAPIAHARAVAAAGGAALVSTPDGVALATSTRAGVDLSPIVPVCGRPLAIGAVGPQRWMVVTSLGISIVDTSSGVPVWVDVAPLAADSDDGFVAAGTDAAAVAACKAAQSHHDGDDDGKHSTIVSRVSVDRTLLLRHGRLYDVRTHGGRSPFVYQAIAVDADTDAVRVSADGTRAYLAGGAPGVVDLRDGALVLAGKHDVVSWVRRRDAEGVSARRVGGNVQVAEVVR